MEESENWTRICPLRYLRKFPGTTVVVKKKILSHWLFFQFNGVAVYSQLPSLVDGEQCLREWSGMRDTGQLS